MQFPSINVPPPSGSSSAPSPNNLDVVRSCVRPDCLLPRVTDSSFCDFHRNRILLSAPTLSRGPTPATDALLQDASTRGHPPVWSSSVSTREPAGHTAAVSSVSCSAGAHARRHGAPLLVAHDTTIRKGRDATTAQATQPAPTETHWNSGGNRRPVSPSVVPGQRLDVNTTTAPNAAASSDKRTIFDAIKSEPAATLSSDESITVDKVHPCSVPLSMLNGGPLGVYTQESLGKHWRSLGPEKPAVSGKSAVSEMPAAAPVEVNLTISPTTAMPPMQTQTHMEPDGNNEATAADSHSDSIIGKNKRTGGDREESSTIITTSTINLFKDISPSNHDPNGLLSDNEPSMHKLPNSNTPTNNENSNNMTGNTAFGKNNGTTSLNGTPKEHVFSYNPAWRAANLQVQQQPQRRATIGPLNSSQSGSTTPTAFKSSRAVGAGSVSAKSSPTVMTAFKTSTASPTSGQLVVAKGLPSTPKPVLFKKKATGGSLPSSPFLANFKQPPVTALAPPALTAGSSVSSMAAAAAKSNAQPSKAALSNRKPLSAGTSIDKQLPNSPNPTAAATVIETGPSSGAHKGTPRLGDHPASAASGITRRGLTRSDVRRAAAATAASQSLVVRSQPWITPTDGSPVISAFKTGSKRRRDTDESNGEASERASRRQKLLLDAPPPAATKMTTRHKGDFDKPKKTSAVMPSATMVVLDGNGDAEEVVKVQILTLDSNGTAVGAKARKRKNGNDDGNDDDDDESNHFSFLHPNRAAAAPPNIDARPGGRRPPHPHPPRTEAELDRLIYSQPAAQLPPPKGVDVPKTRPPIVDPLYPFAFNNPKAFTDGQLYLHMDPRVHYNSARSAAWASAKIAKLSAQRQQDELPRSDQQSPPPPSSGRGRKPAEKGKKDGDEKKTKPAARRDPSPWKYPRPMDFGDVPEEDLPDYVRANPQWLRACAWMRECRRKRITRALEVENRRLLGLDVGDLTRPREKQSTYRPDEEGVWRAKRTT